MASIIEQIRLTAKDDGLVLRQTLDSAIAQLGALLPRIAGRSFARIYLAGCGTSFYAVRSCKQLYETLTGIHTEAAQAYDFARYQSGELLGPDTMIVTFSTAGDTEAVLQVVRKARSHGCYCVAVTAVGKSPVAEASDAVLLTGATDEVSIPRTKAQSQGLIVLAALGIFLAQFLGRGGRDGTAAGLAQLQHAIAGAVEIIRGQDASIRELAETYKTCGSVFVVASGPNVGTAEAGSLMITEMAKIHSLADQFENFLHGRDREFDPHDPVILLYTGALTRERVLDFLAVTRHTGAPTILVTDCTDPEVEGMADHVIRVPGGTDEEYTPISFITPLHLFANHLAVAVGADPSKRRHLDIIPSKVRYRPSAGST